MPAPASATDFVDLVRRSQLLPEARLDEVLTRHRLGGTLPASVDQMANLLVRDGLITFFQAKQLKLGRYKRFKIAEKYKLLELIGAGGMGAVYLCEHTLMRRLVALKVLPVEKLADPSNVDRFYREARAVAALDHPNIVRAYDIDQYEKLHFLVMEYVDGTSLQEIVARYVLEKKTFDPLRAAHYIAQAAIGCSTPTSSGMVHRDIKPGNLLLDRTGVIKVLDMGLARFFNKQQDSVTEKYDDKCVLGTADYLAPEQAVSNLVDIRADVYALGGTFYFMLTGQTPFPDGTITAKLVAHQTREPRSVESFRADVPPGMIEVLRKMMSKEPAERTRRRSRSPRRSPNGRTCRSRRRRRARCRCIARWSRRCPARRRRSPALRWPACSSGRAARCSRVPVRAPRSGGLGRPLEQHGLAEFRQLRHRNRLQSELPDRERARGTHLDRANGATPTAPLPPRPDPFRTGPAPAADGPPQNRTTLYIIIVILLGLLFAVGAVAAYYVGRADAGRATQWSPLFLSAESVWKE